MSPGAPVTRAAALPRTAQVLRYFLPYLRPHRPALGAALVLGAVVSASELLRPWPLQLVFDHVLMPRPGAPRPLGVHLGGMPLPTAVALAAAAVVLVSVVGGLATYGQTLLLSGSGQRVVTKIRRDLFRRLVTLPIVFHTRQRSGDLLLRLTGDIVLLRELVVGSLLESASALLTLAGTLAVMFWLEPRLTLISLAVVPAVAWAGRFLGRRIRRAVRKSRAREGLLSGNAGEALGAIAVVQAFGAAPALEERFGRENRASLRSGLKAARLEAVLSRSLDLLTAIGVGVTLALGTWSVAAGDLTPGGLLVFLAYQRTLYRPVRQLARVAVRAAKAGACGERVIEILEAPVSVADRPNAGPCPPLRGEIHFDGVSVRYPRGDLALDGVQLHIPAGQTVVVRGPSGSGKSTLALLVPRLLDPSAGRVRFDGHDAREFTLASLRAQMGFVFQESVLFGLSVRENIALGRPDATPEELETAARQAGVMRFAADLPDGLDTVVGERGAQLSGGQRQRVALARAALRRPAFLILDEPFAHLDESSRQHVLAALEELRIGRTVILITHQEDPGLTPDLEVLLEGGRVRACRATAKEAVS